MSGLMIDMERSAVISDCENYRYLLKRIWDHEKLRALLVMLNPSTADADVDDPTIRACYRLLDALGYGSFEVVNLFGLRATDPKGLACAVDPVGRDNDRIAEEAAERCDVMVCAWGANPFAAARTHRGRTMVRIAVSSYLVVQCFGLTQKSHPKHPLYIKTGTTLEPWVAKC